MLLESDASEEDSICSGTETAVRAGTAETAAGAGTAPAGLGAHPRNMLPILQSIGIFDSAQRITLSSWEGRGLQLSNTQMVHEMLSAKYFKLPLTIDP